MTKPYKTDQEKWNKFPPGVQLKHIAAELSRATQASLRGNNDLEKSAYERAISLIDASIEDSQWQDKSMLYRLRDAVAALYAEKTNPAVGNFIFFKVMEDAEIK